MSGIETKRENNKIFLKIVEGSLRQETNENNPNAIKREWAVGGDKGTKFELVHEAAFGRITEVSFYDGESGGKRFQTLNISLDENDDGLIPVIGVPVGTKYAQDILKKLPNVKFGEEVRIRPYKFLPDGEDKEVVGVEITQRGSDDKFSKKVENFFVEPILKDGKETFVPSNGYPVRSKPWSEQNDAEREIYKIQVKQFLIDYTKEKIMPKVSKIEKIEEDPFFPEVSAKDFRPNIAKTPKTEEGEVNLDEEPPF